MKRGRPRKTLDFFVQAEIVRLHEGLRLVHRLTREAAIEQAAQQLGTYPKQVRKVLAIWQPERRDIAIRVTKMEKWTAIGFGSRPPFNKRGHQLTERRKLRFGRRPIEIS